ncbi:glycosyltransferase [Bacteroidales bacterium]|nr:glycosyltransferase [Bacteroidales bacterium]
MENITCYAYPNSKVVAKIHSNPYLDNQINAISHYCDVVNRNKKTTKGLFDLFSYHSKTKAFIFNWIEDLPGKRFWQIQLLLLFYVVFLNKIFRNKKIVWVLHNKISHQKDKSFFRKIIFDLMLKNSTQIITHSTEGVRFVADKCKTAKHKTHFIHHPIDGNVRTHKQEKKYDLIIWGTVKPYKGVHDFLKALKDQNKQDDFKILIAGKFSGEDYLNEVKSHAGKQVEIIDDFLEFDELESLIDRSKIILFTYSENSVLSSGSLMDSLLSPSLIVGPNIGAFADLAKENIVKTYDSLNELPNLLNVYIKESSDKNMIEARKVFIKENSWKNFGEFFKNMVNNNIKKN